MSITLSAQDYFNKIDKSIVDCGLNIYSKKLDYKAKQLILQTDSVSSLNYSLIVIEPFDNMINAADYNRIDSLISLKYKDSMILSTQRTDQKYGLMYWYVIKNPNGNPYSDRYTVQYLDKLPFIISYSSIMGNNRENFDRFECLIDKIKQAAPNTRYSQ
jgi:hypothetical protein